MNRFLASAACLSLLGLCLLWPGQSRAQLEQLTEDEAILQAMLAQAEQKFTSGLGPESIVDVRKVINLAQQFATQRPLTQREKDVLLKAYMLRARAFFNLGQMGPAQDDLREALKLNPAIEVNPDEVSQKIIDLLDVLRKQEVGTLYIDSEPGGAEVFLDGQRVGLSPLLPPAPVYKGVHELEVRLQGYDSYSERITILPDQQLQRNVSLNRVTGDIVIYSQPSGAKVFLDDQLVGVTSGSPSPEDRGKFGPEYDFSELSGPYTINYVKPGIHTLRIEKNCFETRVENLSVDTETREFPPFKLGVSRATLVVDSPVDGAKVYLDDQFLGGTPVEQDSICTGTYLLRVEKTGVGQWFQPVTIAKDQKTEIAAELRPTMAYLGIVEHVDKNLVESVSKKLVDNLKELHTLNLRFPDPNQVKDALGAAGIASLKDIASTNIPPDRRDVLANQLRTLCDKLQADMVMLGGFPEQRLQTTIDVYLYLGGHGYADTVPLEFQNPSEVKRFFAGLDYKPNLYESWTGMLTVDLLNAKGLGVIRVSEGGPAKSSGIAPGDTILSVDGEAIASNKTFLQVVDKTSPGKSFKLQAESGGNPRSLELKIDKTPVEIPKNNPDLEYNKILADLQLLSREATNDFEKNFAQLNMAIAFIHFKNFQGAIDMLGKTRFETNSGIGNGTVFYYLGEALSALDYKTEAISNFQKAMSCENCTVGSNDGDLVSRLAEKRLKDLQ
jgi:tetratricopeptide (TPR) repeat protein